MRNKIFILFGLFLFLNMTLFGQCPDRNQLVAKIKYFRDSATIPLKKFPNKERIRQALDYLDAIKNCSIPKDSNYVKLFRTLFFLYKAEGDYYNATNYLRLSNEIIEANSKSPATNRRFLLSGYLYLFSYYDSLNNIPEKMKAVNQCLDVTNEFDAYSDLTGVGALYAITEYAFDIGDYNNCIDNSVNCEKFGWACAKTAIENKDSASNTRAKKLALSALGWHIEALLKLREFKKAQELIMANFDTVRNSGLHEYLGMVYDQLAQIEINHGNFKRASQLLDSSIRNQEHFGDYFNCKQITSDKAYNLYYKIYGDFKGALTLYLKALNYKNTNTTVAQEDTMESLRIFNRIAILHWNKNHFDSSDRYFQLAFDQFKKGANENYILKVPSSSVSRLKKIDYVETLLWDRADAYKSQFIYTKNPDYILKAISTYKIADKFLDTIKTGLFDIHSKLYWRSSAKRLYENAIEACYLQNNSSDAFYFFEKSRAVLLNDQLNEQRWLNQTDILKQNQLKRNIQDFQRQQGALLATSRGYSDLQNEIFENRRQLEKLQDEIKTNNPLYYQSFVDKNVITIDDVRKKILNDHVGLIQLFAGDSAVYILAISKQNTFFKKIDKHLYDSLAEKFRNYLTNSKPLVSEFNEFISASNQLYNLIFQNINLPSGRLIVSPDGKYFPFEALIINPQTKYYFLNDYAVSYTYSARYLLNNFQQNSTTNSNSFFGIAPVEFSNGFPALSGSDQALMKMKNYFSNATMLMHQQASKNNFLNQFTKYGIIQLYAHATDSGANGEPAIYFADSSLSLSDLFYGSKPVTRLIVLSACQTALGKVQSGEGVFSFNRGFAALGIPSAISTLWSVNDEATYELTNRFYQYLRKGDSLDVALQKAKKEVMALDGKYQQPYYWAAPILFGQSGKIPMQSPSMLWLIPIGLLLAFAFWLDRKSFK